MAQAGWPCWRVLQHSPLPPPLPCSFPVLLSIPWLPVGISRPSGGFHPTWVCVIMRSLCATSRRQGPKELCRQQPSANCSSTSKIQVSGAFPRVSCEMVPGGCAGEACPLQSRASPTLPHGFSPPCTLGHRGGGNARAGDRKPLPRWRPNRAYAHQAASPPEGDAKGPHPCRRQSEGDSRAESLSPLPRSSKITRGFPLPPLNHEMSLKAWRSACFSQLLFKWRSLNVALWFVF